MIIRLTRGSLVLVMTMLFAAPTLAQRDRPQDSGPLQSPKPYGDRGTRIIGNPPIQYPNRPPAGVDQAQYWRNRVISNPGIGGSIIIINGSPCYTPFYYGYGRPGAFHDSYVYGSLNLGGVNLGYSQRQSNYGFAGPMYPNVQRPVDVRTQPYVQDMRERDAQRSEPRRQAAGDDEPSYYLHQKPRGSSLVSKDPSLAVAVGNIERAFRTGDIRQLEPHVNSKDSLMLAAKGQKRTALPAETYLDLTRDALRNLKTLKFELPNAEPASNGAILVYGTHVIQAQDGKAQTFHVGFVLVKRGEQWFIIEVSADPAIQPK